jgi:hypothetical protein
MTGTPLGVVEVVEWGLLFDESTVSWVIDSDLVSSILKVAMFYPQK